MAERDAGARAIIPLSPYSVSVSYNGSRVSGSASGWFGPLQPLSPVAPPSVTGRRFDYPTGYNLNVRPRTYERIGFDELRALADNYDLLRLVIETRKDQVERCHWTIRPNAEEFGSSKTKPSKALLNRCKEIRTFFTKPDQQTRWKRWLRPLLEQLFVFDAPTLYRRPTRSGGLFGLEVIDGTTIVPKIDEGGRVIGYQQVLKGLPAVDYDLSQLIYRPRNVRADRVYGYSPVEQIVMTVNIALRRQVWQLQYYTEGNVPDALIGVPETWTPDQIGAFQAYWDSVLEGNTAQRRHAKFVPGGIAKTFIPTKEPELKNVFDEWLARVVCFCFSISPQPFVAQVNRATADTAKEAAAEEGLQPVLDWVKDLIDERIQEDFNEPDAEFAWVEEESVDPKVQSEVLVAYVKGGILRPNEARAKIGEEPDPDPVADKLGTVTAAGFVPLEISAAPPPEPVAPEVDDNGNPLPPAAGKPPGQPGAKPPKAKAKDEPSKKDDQEVGKAANLPFAKGWRQLPPMKPTRKRARAAATSLRDRIAPLLAKVGAAVAKQVKEKLAAVAKADETEEERQARIRALAERIAQSVDLSGLDVLVDVTAEEIESLVRDTSGRVLAQLGVNDRSELVDQVNERAVEMANERAAELVGKRWVGGELVDNPNAEYRIDEGTRDMIRRAIADGLDQNDGLDDIVGAIQDLGFSEERADLIARTEIARANSDAALVGYQAAESVGVSVRKLWLLGENPCPICEANAEQGPIDLDEEFESGDDAPPAHPNCLCDIAPVVDEDTIGGDTETE